MNWCTILLFGALATSLAAGGRLRRQVHQKEKRFLHSIEDGEEKCCKDSGLSKDQVRKSGCTRPLDPELKQRVMKYSLCSMMNTHQMLANGTFVFTPLANCSAAALAVTDPPSSADAPRPHMNHHTRVVLCGWQEAFYTCQQKIGGREGLSAGQKAMEYRICLCEDFLNKIRSKPTTTSTTAS